ncbi:MAG: thiolase [Alphaproteobacteria bacterium]|nr:thiolase [Alphaproteobacteria bacterium]
MSRSLRGKSAIVGAALATPGPRPGWSAQEILADAVGNVLDQTGLTLKDVDGLFVGSAFHYTPTLSMAEYLGLRPRFSDSNMVGGSSFVGHLLTAAMALQSGQCDVALICYGSNQATAGGRLHSMAEPQPYEAPYAPRYPVSSYAFAAQRHMHTYGTTRTQLAHVATAARAWAASNPEAQERCPLSIDDVLNARMISDPLSKLDCCLVTDGGGAVIMVRADRANDFPEPPVYLLGAAGAHWHRQISAMPDLTVTAASESGPRAFAMAGFGPQDIDVVQLYDAFTINTLLLLEDLGFCPKGEGGPFVASGAIAPGGDLPVNTNGGGLSCCHPGMYGIFLIIEAVRQLRGAAPGQQIRGAETALVHGNGGVLSSQITAILGNEQTL